MGDERVLGLKLAHLLLPFLLTVSEENRYGVIRHVARCGEFYDCLNSAAISYVSKLSC